ncbi:MAG: flagellin [Cycloclasticus sp.]
MPQFINSNIASLTAQRNLNTSQNSLTTSLERLSSGLRINSAKDDAAGLAISERFTSQIRGLNQAQRNANDGVSLAQTAEAALGSSSDMLQRIRELAVQSANATNSDSDRAALQGEATQLLSELSRVATQSSFNGRNLLDGTFGTVDFQVGANAGETIQASTANFSTSSYGNNQMIGTATTGTATATGSVAATAFTIAGSAGTKVFTAPTAGDSMKSVAAAVNAATSTTGVTATAKTETTLAFAATGSHSFTLKGDSSTASNISATVSANTPDGLENMVTAINDKAGATGIIAKVNTAGTGITLTHNTGENMVLVDDGAAATNPGNITVAGQTLTDDATADTVTVTGQITMDSEKSFSFTSTGTTIETSGGSALSAVSTIDISTVSGANNALKIADAALGKINSQRAAFGALQSRFESTVNNIQSTSESLSAARSRIRDADFAQETASLTRAQILQQAGISILSQANSLPQNVLALLQ